MYPRNGTQNRTPAKYYILVIVASDVGAAGPHLLSGLGAQY